jgi:opacity protein-like surface antigen
MKIQHSLACVGTAHAGAQSWSDGWTAGGGIEYLILPNVTLRVEYRYPDFTFYQTYVPRNTALRRPHQQCADHLHPTFQTVRAGVAFKF